MYFPWFGLFDQIRLSDIFVFYDDVQLARGFYNRVQVKTRQGTAMLTVPIKNKHRGQNINESIISYDDDWIGRHRQTLIHSYRSCAYLDDAISIFDAVTNKNRILLSDIGRDSIRVIIDYLGLVENRSFLLSSDLGICGASSERLLRIAQSLEAETYLTGHGALRYLDHELFDANAIEVRYMNYQIARYPQFFGDFTPYVSVLDIIAHLGPSAIDAFESSSVNWRKAVERPAELLP